MLLFKTDATDIPGMVFNMTGVASEARLLSQITDLV